jgi:hypothetical protein
LTNRDHDTEHLGQASRCLWTEDDVNVSSAVAFEAEVQLTPVLVRRVILPPWSCSSAGWSTVMTSWILTKPLYTA